jgi:hypothetical protein
VIAEPSTILTVEEAHLAPGFVYSAGLRRSQFREITISQSIVAVLEVALLFCQGHCTGFGLGKFQPVAGSHAIVAVGDIPLVVGHGQCNRFRFA